MTDRKGRTLGTILGFFRVIYGLIWFAAGAGFLMTILMPFSSSIKDDFCRIPINFMLRSADIGFFVSGSIHATVLARSTGWLVIKDGPMPLAYANLLVCLIIAAALLYSLKKTIQIIERIRDGQVFLVENMLDLRRIAGVWLLFFLFFAILKIAAVLFVFGRLVSGPLAITGAFGSSLDLDLGSLVFPLFLWALAEVFRSGIEMKAEQDLVI
jgi:hypothetical protein